jgi:hypothetical protein
MKGKFMKNEMPKDVFFELENAVKMLMICASPDSVVRVTNGGTTFTIEESGKQSFLVAATSIITMSGMTPADFGIDIKTSGLGIQ